MGVLPKKKQMLEALKAGIQKKIKEQGLDIPKKADTDTGSLTLIPIPELLRSFTYS